MSSTILPMFGGTSAVAEDKSGTVGIFFGFGRKVSIEKMAIVIACLGLFFSLLHVFLLIGDGMSVLYELFDLIVYSLLFIGLWKRKPTLIKIFSWAYALNRLVMFFILYPTAVGIASALLIIHKSVTAPLTEHEMIEYHITLLFVYGLVILLSSFFSAYVVWITLRAYKLMHKENMGMSSMQILRSSSPITTACISSAAAAEEEILNQS